MLLQKVNREEMIYYSLILNSFFFSHTQEQKGVLTLGQEEQPHWKQIHLLSIHVFDDVWSVYFAKSKIGMLPLPGSEHWAMNRGNVKENSRSQATDTRTCKDF